VCLLSSSGVLGKGGGGMKCGSEVSSCTRGKESQPTPGHRERSTKN
jgi:hypothetical protein